MTATLPFLYGCGAGAGTGSLVGFLFGGGTGGGVTLLASGTTDILAGGGGAAGLATLHHPEPASMFLVGSGLLAMGFFRSKTSNRS